MKFLVLIALLGVTCHHVEGGNNRPYGVGIQGFEGAGRVGQDASANGYAGSSLVAPTAVEGGQRNAPRPAFPGNPSGIGFGGFGWRPQSSSGYGSGGY